MNRLVGRKPVSYWLGAAVATVLGLYVVLEQLLDEDHITPVGGHYYTAALDNGTSLNWFKHEGEFNSPPLLEKVYTTARNDSFVVARAGTNIYLAYPVRASSWQQANANRLGPFTKAELTKTMLRLVGDSVLRNTERY